jgi:hypothetical protein
MNIRRDFFRLWLVLSALWLASGIWLFWDDLSGKLRPDEVAAQIKIYPLEGHILRPLDGVRKRRTMQSSLSCCRHLDYWCLALQASGLQAASTNLGGHNQTDTRP